MHQPKHANLKDRQQAQGIASRMEQSRWSSPAAPAKATRFMVVDERDIADSLAARLRHRQGARSSSPSPFAPSARAQSGQNQREVTANVKVKVVAQ